MLRAAGHGSAAWRSVIRAAGDAERVLSMKAAALCRHGIEAAAVARLREPVPKHWRDWLAEAAHDVVPFGSAAYPDRLAEIADAPLALWIDGRRPSLLGEPQIAIVGSRHPTRNGRAAAAGIARALSEAGVTVTSGLALGIDAAGHSGAVPGIGGTIAVLGSGIDVVYPTANRSLAEEIREGGLIVSEYPPGTPVRGHQFPQRNRIIAALSLGTVVIEANRRSGSLITARLAAEYGREVFAMPGSVLSPLSKGCHKLLRDGATLIEDVGDILREVAPQLLAAVSAPVATSNSAHELPPALAQVIDYSPVSLDTLISETGLTAAELSSMLLHLEMQGKIEALPGGRYCRLAKRT